MKHPTPADPETSRRSVRAAALIGFGFGGFFDGILLHQVLQWHHLLSGVARGGLADLRMQVLADGLFHAAMYAVAAAGVLLMLRARHALARAGAAQRFTAALLLGFGAWHVADALLSHWLLGLHRIRMDSAVPLAWDLLWLAVFGLLPAAAGAVLWRRPVPEGPPRPSRLPLSVLLATVLAGGVAAVPPAGGGDTAVVVLRDGARPAALLAAADASLLWADGPSGVLVLRTGPGWRPRALYHHGALYVSGTLSSTDCSSFVRVAGAIGSR